MRPDEVSRAVVDGIGAIVWEARPGREPGEAHFSFVSDGTTAVLGHPPERWTEDPRFWLSICHPDDRERVIGHILAAVREGRAADFEFRAVHADGRPLWLRDIVRVEPDPEGGPPRMSGVVVDITPRKVAEERLARVHAVTMRLTGLLEREEIARTVVAEGRAALGAVAAAVYVLDGGRLELLAAEGYPEEALAELGSISPSTDTPAAEVLRTGRPVWIATADEADQRYPGRPAKAVGRGATCALPLVAEERVLGSLVVRMAEEREFPNADRVLLDVLAVACGQALLLSQSLATEQRANALLDTIIEKAPEGWALFDRELRYVRVNEALARINGVPAEEHPGRTLAEIVPDLPEEAHLEPLRRVLRTGEPVELEVEGRTPAAPDRPGAWIVSYYPVRSASGEIVALGALITDITDRKRAEERAALLAELGPILEEAVGVEQRLERLAHALVPAHADMATVTLQEDGDLQRVASAHIDPALERELAQLAPTDVTTLGESTVVIGQATDDLLRAVTVDEQHLEQMRQVGYRSAVIAPMHARGRRVGTLGVGSLRPRAFGPDEVTLVEEVAARAALAVDNARLYESERRARERIARLQTITAALSEALTPSDVARSVLDAGMPAVGAHMGSVWQLDEDGHAIVPLAQEGHPPGTEGWRDLPLSQPQPTTDALREGRILHLTSLEEKVARWPHLEAEFRSRGAGSMAVLPLFARGEPVGAISLSFPRRVTLGDEDLRFLESLASQCAQALERARLYEAERRVAATLQRSLLPQRLPSVDGVEFAVRYLPAAGLAAGGDFYEAIQLPGGAVGVAVGDVVGRGSNAAAAMGQLRSALRAFALDGAPPAEVLTRLSAFADTVEGALAATAAYAVVDVAAGELRYACAGHPWPLLVGSDGRSRYLTAGRSLPLACMTDPTYHEAVEPLAPGDTLLLFTDGLTERRGVDVDESMERLRTAVSGDLSTPLATLLDDVVSGLGADAPLDDVALLAVRLSGPAGAIRRLRAPAAPETVASARSEIRRWLDEAGVDRVVTSDVLLAAGEALANAVEHAYRDRLPGEVEVVLRVGHEIELEVHDAGSWKESGGDPDRGRGFALMRALMHAVEVQRSPAGTIVLMRRAIREAPPAGMAEGLEVRGPMPASVDLRRDGQELVAVVAGDLDLASAPELAQRLAAEAGDAPLVLDLGAAGYLDSAGTRMLVELSRVVDLTVIAPPGSVARRSLDLAGLDANLRVRP